MCACVPGEDFANPLFPVGRQEKGLENDGNKEEFVLVRVTYPRIIPLA
jgi:hypothetical protein